jgi:hypothetical protein
MESLCDLVDPALHIETSDLIDFNNVNKLLFFKNNSI